jgi:hypothetical protein
MLLLKNLLFIAVATTGSVILVTNLLPPKHEKPLTFLPPETFQEDSFQQTVSLVNQSFRKTWNSEGIQPALEADSLAVIRRLSLGLMGTVPSLEEIRQIESLPASQRVSWWVDHILHDRRYAEFVAERMARAYVGTENGPFIFFRRRKFVLWLADEIAKNRPYDELARELITTDGLWTDKPATNFITVTIEPDNKKKENQPDPIRLAGRVTRAFLGLRLDCAQCHDHPFAAWKQGDFEGFAAFFGQTHVGFRGVYDGKGDFEIVDRKTQKPRTVEPRVAFSPELLPDQGALRQKLAVWVTHDKNPYFARATVNRFWAIMCGQPLVAPIDNLEREGPIPEALDILAKDFSSHGYDMARLIGVIANSEVYQRESLSRLDSSEMAEKTWAQFPLTRLRPEQVAGAVLQATTVATINAESHILTRLIRYGDQNDFIKRYGDNEDDEFDGRGGTIPQRLVMMNGKMVREKTQGGPFGASTRISWLAPNDESALETVFLAALTRRPTANEKASLENEFKDNPSGRGQAIQDLFWALINSTEFSWNH